MKTRILAHLRRFRRSERGGILAETIIVLPMLIWAYLAMFVYWDVYRAVNIVQKSSYSLSDFLSRQRVPVNADFINGLRDSMNFMLPPDQSATIRVTSVQWSQAQNRFNVLWSHSPGSVKPALSTNNLAPIRDHLPVMSNGDTVVVLETFVPYEPMFKVGIPSRTLGEVVVTRPRFVPRVDWSNT